MREQLMEAPATETRTSTGQPLELSGIRKTYGRSTAVDGLSLDIPAGEFVTFLGPSGSGKTTSLMVVAGFVEPDEGSVVVGGRDVTSLAPRRRGFGFVFQQYLLFPHMTVAENIAFPLQVRRLSRQEIRTRVADTLDLVGLAGLGSRRPRELSGGQQQRVALCRALVYRPPVLLMDEPLGALDKKLRDQLQTEIKNIQHELGLTVVYVTHDQEEALVMSDRIAVMRDGRLEQCGTPRELYERPATPFVADFLGAANFLEGHIVDSDDDGCLVHLDAGATVRARPQPLAAGTRVRVAVQPGRVRIDGDGDAFARGVVRTIAYVGSVVRVGVAVEGIDSLIRVEQPGTACPDYGNPVSLTSAAADIRVFTAGGHDDQ